MKYLFSFFLTLLLFWVLFLSVPVFRAGVKAVLFIPEVWPGLPVTPLSVVTSKPIIENHKVSTDSGEIEVQVYRKKEPRKLPAAIFVMAGVSPTEGYIAEYAESFSRLGFAVVVPRFEDLVDINKIDLNYEQVTELENVFKFTRDLPYVNKEKVGFLGICDGASLAIIASEDEKIAQEVKYIVAISPYFDAYSTFKQIYLKSVIENNQIVGEWRPNIATIVTTNRLLTSNLKDDSEKEILRAFDLEGRMQIDEEDIEKLSDEGKSVYLFLTNRELAKFDELWNDLPADLRNNLERLSPKKKIGSLRAPVYLLTDDYDRYVPRTESDLLNASLPSGKKVYVRMKLLEHTYFSRKLPRLKTLKELFRLFSFSFGTLEKIS